MPLDSTCLQFAAYGEMDVGLHRTALEDAFFICEEKGLFVVSDGVGGTVAGGLASTITVRMLPLKLNEVCGSLEYAQENESIAKAVILGRTVDDVRNLLLEKTSNQPAVKGLGATVVAGYYVGNSTMALTHLGDSRAYLLRDGVLERLTQDHTVAQMLYQMGHITKEQLMCHPDRHILTRYVGMKESIATQVVLLPLQKKDRLLFCTDGLTDMLSEKEIGAILSNCEAREQAARSLIAAANDAGGHDNITVVVVDVLPQFTSQEQHKEIEVREGIGYSFLASDMELTKTVRESAK